MRWTASSETMTNWENEINTPSSTPSFPNTWCTSSDFTWWHLIFSKRRNPHVPQTGSSISDGNPQRKISRWKPAANRRIFRIPGRTLETAELRKRKHRSAGDSGWKTDRWFRGQCAWTDCAGRGVTGPGALPPGTREAGLNFFLILTFLCQKTRKFFL